MKHMVTFCAFDQTVEGNPFWHGSFFLSQLDESKQLLEVVDAWGFYGVTSTGDRNSWLGKLKLKLAMDVDLQGNHGMLGHEELRFMDLGHGLHGYTFEITQGQFEELQNKCATVIEEQEAAIKEVVGTQNIKLEPTRKVRFYKEEPMSHHIFEIEKYKAKMEGRPPRLRPFDFHFSFGSWGLSLKKSHTCKTTALSILESVLTEEQLAPFKNRSLPRFIPGLESILLHSTGPLRKHIKASGKQVFYRDRNDPDVKLYWSVPPQRLDALSEDTKSLFSINEEYCQEVKNLVSKLQRLEWLIRNASLPEKYQDYKEDLIKRIIECYQVFALITLKQNPKITGWLGFALSFFSLPKCQEEQTLQDNIQQAKILLNSLYMATVDEWQIDDNLPSETDQIKDAEDCNSLEAVVSYLPIKDKKALCKIIGRNYLEREKSSSVAFSE